MTLGTMTSVRLRRLQELSDTNRATYATCFVTKATKEPDW
jgi:hypothetical protein